LKANKNINALFCLSPSGNGEDFSCLYSITSKYNFILVASNDFANYKPLKDYFPKIKKSLNDIEAKFNIRLFEKSLKNEKMEVYEMHFHFSNLFIHSVLGVCKDLL